MFVLDTDMLSLYQHGDALVCQRVHSHAPDDLAITVMTIEEQLSGWYTLLRRAKQPPQVARVYQQLAENVLFLSGWRILLYPETAIARCDQLLSLKLGVRKGDLRIAAITLENAGILVTRNLRDFQRVPNLTIENWAA